MAKGKAKSKRVSSNDSNSPHTAAARGLPEDSPASTVGNESTPVPLRPSLRALVTGFSTIVTVERVDDVSDAAAPSDARVTIHPSRMLEDRLAAGGLVLVTLPAPSAPASSPAPRHPVAPLLPPRALASAGAVAPESASLPAASPRGASELQLGDVAVLAAVWPSSQVSKAGCRLSWPLAASLCCPQPGRLLSLRALAEPSAAGAAGPPGGPLPSPASPSALPGKEPALQATSGLPLPPTWRRFLPVASVPTAAAASPSSAAAPPPSPLRPGCSSPGPPASAPLSGDPATPQLPAPPAPGAPPPALLLAPAASLALAWLRPPAPGSAAAAPAAAEGGVTSSASSSASLPPSGATLPASPSPSPSKGHTAASPLPSTPPSSAGPQRRQAGRQPADSPRSPAASAASGPRGEGGRRGAQQGGGGGAGRGGGFEAVQVEAVARLLEGGAKKEGQAGKELGEQEGQAGHPPGAGPPGSLRGRALAELFAARWLLGRQLMAGNTVAVPICGQMCTFVLTSGAARREGGQGGAQSSASTSSESRGRELTWQDSGFKHDDGVMAYLVDSQTAVRLLPAVPEEPRLPPPQPPADAGGTTAASGGTEEGNDDVSFARRVAADLSGVSLSSVAGMAEHKAALREAVLLPLRHPELFDRFGVRPPRGVLLHGPPGTGKTSLARAVAAEAGAAFFAVSAPELVSEWLGESEARLNEVFIDELDAIASARAHDSDPLSQRLVAALLTALDGTRPAGSPPLASDGPPSQNILQPPGSAAVTIPESSFGDSSSTRAPSPAPSLSPRVVIIAATNRVSAIDPALRRPGRFDRELAVGVPSPADRLAILQRHLAGLRHRLAAEYVAELATARLHGFVGADVAALCREASMGALRRHVGARGRGEGTRAGAEKGEVGGSTAESVCGGGGSAVPPTEGGPQLGLEEESGAGAGAPPPPWELAVLPCDVEAALRRVRPSALREVAVEVPRVQWSDIGGYEDVKQRLRESVEWPFRRGEEMRRVGAQAPRGILLFGPPGCSKTLMARAVASEAGLNFLSVKGPELLSKWVGESEKAVRTLFARAASAAPSVIFLDEIDGLVAARREGSSSRAGGVADRVLLQLLQEMDALSRRASLSVVLAATNRPDLLDTALLRPGRFDRLLYVGPPDCAARRRIFAVQLRGVPCDASVDAALLAERSEGCTGADIAALCREAKMAALEEDLSAAVVAERHFAAAFRVVRPSAAQVPQFYASFQRGLVG